MGHPDLRDHKVDEIAVGINSAKPLAPCLHSRLGSPIGIIPVVLLTPPLSGPELVLVLQNELHLSECWTGKGQEQQVESQKPDQSPFKDWILMDPPPQELLRPRPGLRSFLPIILAILFACLDATSNDAALVWWCHSKNGLSSWPRNCPHTVTSICPSLMTLRRDLLWKGNWS